MKREIFFKNLISTDKARKLVVVKELVHYDGIVAKSARTCFYHISVICKINNPFDLDEVFIKQLKAQNHKPRNIYIRRNLNPEEGEKKFGWRVTGRLYIVSKDYILACDFRHTFKLELIDLKQKII